MILDRLFLTLYYYHMFMKGGKVRKLVFAVVITVFLGCCSDTKREGKEKMFFHHEGLTTKNN
jgi:hypothetical protein